MLANMYVNIFLNFIKKLENVLLTYIKDIIVCRKEQVKMNKGSKKC